MPFLLPPSLALKAAESPVPFIWVTDGLSHMLSSRIINQHHLAFLPCYSIFRIHFSIISYEPLFCLPSLLGLIFIPFILGRPSRGSLTLNILSWLTSKTASWYTFWPFQIPSEQGPEKKHFCYFTTISHSDDSKCRILYL